MRGSEKRRYSESRDKRKSGRIREVETEERDKRDREERERAE